jgi:hypothetical protein
VHFICIILIIKNMKEKRSFAVEAIVASHMDGYILSSSQKRSPEFYKIRALTWLWTVSADK